MELKIFQRKNVSFINMLEFLLKALVLFDTNNLYSRRQKLAKVDNNNIFNQCFNTQKGGSLENNERGSGSGSVSKTGTESVSVTESGSGNGTGNKTGSGNGNGTGTGNKSGTESVSETGSGDNETAGSGDNESVGSGDNESVGNESGNGSGNETAGTESDVNGKLLHYKSELITYFNKGTDAVKNKIAYLMSFIAFASIYPALPFFVVLATLYGLLKWLFSKIRML